MQRLALPRDRHDGRSDESGDADGDDDDEEPKRGTAEKKVTLSKTLTVDHTNRDAVRVVLDALRNSVEEGDVSWLQPSIQATVTPEVADDLDDKAQAATMHTTVSDL